MVGENTVRGTFIRNAMIVEAVANTGGLRCTGRRSRDLPANRRYLPPPSQQPALASLGKRNLSTTMGHSTGLIKEQFPVWRGVWWED